MENFLLTLYAGYGCVLNCRYCLLDKDQRKKMNVKTYSRILSLLKKTNNKNIIVAFHGGEPLLHYKDIYRFIKLSQTIPNIKIDYSIVTNGLLLDKNKINFLNKQNLSLRISLDGNFATQIKNRIGVNIDNSKYNQKLTENIRLLLENFDHSRLQVNMVVAPNTVEDVIENVRYLTDLGFTRISLDYASGINWTQKGIEKFSSKISELTALNLKIFNYNNIDKLRYMLLAQINTNEVASLKKAINQEIKFLCIDYDGSIFSEEIFTEDMRKITYLADIFEINNFDEISSTWLNFEKLLINRESAASERKLANIMFDFVKICLKT